MTHGRRAGQIVPAWARARLLSTRSEVDDGLPELRIQHPKGDDFAGPNGLGDSRYVLARLLAGLLRRPTEQHRLMRAT